MLKNIAAPGWALMNAFILLVLVLSQAVHAQSGTWQRIDLNNKASLRGSAVYQNSLWVTGSNNTVFVSQDAGKTWHDRSVSAEITTDFRDIALFDHNHAIVMGAGTGPQSVLYQTLDAGKTWQRLLLNAAKSGFFNAIAFWDKNTGLLLGDPVDGYYVIKKTQDGGKTWRRIALDKLPTIADNEAAFAASGNTLITGANGQAWLTTGGFAASVYYSNDWGESWRRQAVPLFRATATAGGYALALNQRQQVFVLGGDYQQRAQQYQNIAVYAQQQWQPVDAGLRGLRTAMACNNSVCIISGRTGSDISFDQGQHWQAFDDASAAKTQAGFYTLASSEHVILAAGEQGKVALYVNE